MSAVREVVPQAVCRRVVDTLEHVVAFRLIPVEGVLRTDRAVAGVRRVTAGSILTTLARKTRLSNGLVADITGNPALEAVHVHLLSSRIRVVDPEKATDTHVVRAWRHLLRNLELVLEEPWAGVDNAEDDKVLRLNIVDIGLVGNSERAASRIVNVVGVDSSGRLPRASQIRVGVTDITTLRGRPFRGVALVA